MSEFMKRWGIPLGMIAVGLVLMLLSSGASPPDELRKSDAVSPPASVEEARGRAKLLHETIHDTLQIVHSRYYREDEGLPIPAATLKVVFQRMAERNGVELRWLAVDARAMNTDHKPRDGFEKDAVKALISGEDEYEQAGDGLYRHVGVVTLHAECLKCHMPSRTSNKSRMAGLLIALPIEKK